MTRAEQTWYAVDTVARRLPGSDSRPEEGRRGTRR